MGTALAEITGDFYELGDSFQVLADSFSLLIIKTKAENKSEDSGVFILSS